MKFFLIASGIALLCVIALAAVLLVIADRVIAWYDEEREP